MSKCVFKPRYEFCADCIHHTVCMWQHCPQDQSEHCQFYKDKSLFVELPCKVGTKVYRITCCEQFHDTHTRQLDYECPCLNRLCCPFDTDGDFDCEELNYEKAIFEDVLLGYLNDYGEWSAFFEYTQNAELSDFGETIFTNREEAEAKLKEIKK